MLKDRYIKPSQVIDFANPTSSVVTQAVPLNILLFIRIIYRSLNYAESLNQPTKSSRSNQAKLAKQSKIASAEIFGSIAVAVILIALFGGVA